MSLNYRHIATCCAAALLGACSNGGMSPDLRAGTDPIAAANNLSVQSEVTQSNPVAPTRQHTQKLHYKIGPVQLAPQSDAETMQDNPATLTFRTHESVWMTGFRMHLEDEHGKRLPNELLHSALLINHNDTNSLCDSKPLGNPFVASSAAQTELELPEGYGYALLPTDPLEARVILHNPNNNPYPAIFVNFTIEAVGMNNRSITQDVTTYLMDSDPCAHEPIAVEPGAYITEQVQAALPHAGNIVAAHGVLQQHSVKLALNVNGAPDAVWQGETTLDDARNVISAPQFALENDQGVRVNQGDPLLLSVSYQNFSEDWLNHATARAMLYVAPSEELESSASKKPFITKRTPKASSVQSMLLQ